MESINEAWLMLGLDSEQISQQDRDLVNNTNWMISALIVHAYNLKSGLMCTGFDEDDPETSENILNLPSNFVQNSTELMTFRYSKEGVEGEIILKIIP